MRRLGIWLLAAFAATGLAACGASRVGLQLSASADRDGADVRAAFRATHAASSVRLRRLPHGARVRRLHHSARDRRLPHRGLALTAAQRARLIAEDPALRFVLLDVPHDPPLHPSRALLAVAGRVLNLRIDGQHVVVILPKRPNGRAVLFEHGSDETASFNVDVHRSGRLITALVGAGYAWAESDADFNNWGNAASVEADAALAGWLRAHGDEQIDIGGDSMGGLDATQLIPLVHPQAVFELFPVCDESSVMHLFSVDIRHADAPVSALSPVAMRGVANLPLLITASPGDTLVPKRENADVCAAEAQAAGARVVEVTTTGEHDDPSNWEPTRIIGFLDSAAQAAGADPAQTRR